MQAPVAAGIDEVIAVSGRESLEALAAAARQRQPGAFDALAARIAGRLMAFAQPIVRDRGLAEEAVQETLIRVYRFLPSYTEKNFLAWCLTITNRACLNLIRRERRHTLLRFAVGPAHTPDPTQVVGSRVEIQAALASLPVHLRRAFLLHQQGLGYEEIGAIVGVPVGTVRSRLFRARDALRKQLRPGDAADESNAGTGDGERMS